MGEQKEEKMEDAAQHGGDEEWLGGLAGTSVTPRCKARAGLAWRSQCRYESRWGARCRGASVTSRTDP